MIPIRNYKSQIQAYLISQGFKKVVNKDARIPGVYFGKNGEPELYICFYCGFGFIKDMKSKKDITQEVVKNIDLNKPDVKSKTIRRIKRNPFTKN